MGMRFAKRDFGIRGVAFSLVLAAGTLSSASAQDAFRYRHYAGDKWHLTSTVDEDVLIDGEFLYGTEILNKISVEIREGEGGDGVLWNRYSIAERSPDSDVYAWSEEYEAAYSRDESGRLGGLPPDSTVPMVRDVPVFPDYPLSPGDAWTARGVEVFDLAPSFGIPAVLEIPFEAEYRYVGPVERDGRSLHSVSIEYGFSWRPDAEDGMRRYAFFPEEIAGVFDQEVLWDGTAGRNYAEEGRFSYTYAMNDGHSYTFRGASRGEAVYAEPMDRDALVEEIEELSDDLGGISAQSVEEGVSVTLEDIHFKPDRAEMLPGQDDLLARIAGVLSRYPERDILVVGHTAKIPGYGDGRELSEMRAQTVARYFIDNGVRDASQVMTRGMGNTAPVGDNATEEGRRRNRRVEIIILEN